MTSMNPTNPFGAEKLFLLTAVDGQIFRFPTLHVGGWRMGILGFHSKRFQMYWKQYQKKLWNVECWVTWKKNTKPTKRQTSEYCQSGQLHLKSWNYHFFHHVHPPFRTFSKPTRKSLFRRRFVVESKKNSSPSIQQWSARCPWWLHRSPGVTLLDSYFPCFFLLPPVFFWKTLLEAFWISKKCTKNVLLLNFFGKTLVEMIISNLTISESLLHSGWSNSLLGLVMAILTLAHNSTSQVDLTGEKRQQSTTPSQWACKPKRKLKKGEKTQAFDFWNHHSILVFHWTWLCAKVSRGTSCETWSIGGCGSRSIAVFHKGTWEGNMPKRFACWKTCKKCCVEASWRLYHVTKPWGVLSLKSNSSHIASARCTIYEQYPAPFGIHWGLRKIILNSNGFQLQDVQNDWVQHLLCHEATNLHPISSGCHF